MVPFQADPFTPEAIVDVGNALPFMLVAIAIIIGGVLATIYLTDSDERVKVIKALKKQKDEMKLKSKKEPKPKSEKAERKDLKKDLKNRQKALAKAKKAERKEFLKDFKKQQKILAKFRKHQESKYVSRNI